MTSLDAVSVKIDNETYPVKSTALLGLKQIDFRFKEKSLRGLDQNPETKSRWAAMARDGKKVMQFLEGGRYLAVVCDRKVHLYKKSDWAYKLLEGARLIDIQTFGKQGFGGDLANVKPFLSGNQVAQ